MHLEGKPDKPSNFTLGSLVEDKLVEGQLTADVTIAAAVNTWRAATQEGADDAAILAAYTALMDSLRLRARVVLEEKRKREMSRKGYAAANAR